MVQNNTKKTSKKKNSDIIKILSEKHDMFLEILQRTLISVNLLKQMDILSTSNLAICNDCIELIFKKINESKKNINSKNINEKVSLLQDVNSEISSLFKKYGCKNLTDFITVCFDKNYLDNNVTSEESGLLEVLIKLFHPINYKSILWSNIPTDLDEESPLLEDFTIAKYAKNFQCYGINMTNNFKLECSGLKIVIHNPTHKRSLIVTGIINEISLNCLHNSNILEKIQMIRDIDDDIEESLVERYIASLTIKDLLVFSAIELRNTLYGYISSMKILKTKSLMSIVKQFTKNNIIDKRNTIIQLLLFENEQDFQYIAYLLYDLLTSDSNNMIDSKNKYFYMIVCQLFLKNILKKQWPIHYHILKSYLIFQITYLLNNKYVL